ncbi:MAG: sialidase family protein [Legionellales bacterium]
MNQRTFSFQKYNSRPDATEVKFSVISLAIAALLATTDAAFAANFSIIPTEGLVLPTSLYAGEAVSAYYTVTNNTSTTRLGYSLQGLPASVTQNTQNTKYCQNPITLPSHTSCTLQLDITRPVQSGFVLCKGSSCTTAATPLNVKQANAAPAVVAAGAYQSTNAGNYYYPLLATSKDGGVSWAYTIDSYTTTLPADYVTWVVSSDSVFTSASCTGQICVAAGNYSNGVAIYPLIATSKDSGNTWVYTLDSLTPTSVPGDFSTANNTGVFASASCTGQTCVVAGTYPNSTAQYPLIATSQDGGNTWGYTLDSSSTPSVPTDFSTVGAFTGASCTGQACVAVGSYYNGTVYYPLVATSKDNGNTWIFTVDSYKTALPVDYVSGAGGMSSVFTSVSCSGQTCVAAGAYSNTGANNTYPLIATSNDSGNTWTYTVDSATTLPSDYVTGSQGKGSAVFTSVSCTGQICVAAGSYSNGTAIYPLVAMSKDSGNTWVFTVDSYTTALPVDYVTGGGTGSYVFNSTSCTGLTCVAAGAYFNGTAIYPLIVTSKDSGNTWSYTLDSSSSPSVPVDFSTLGEFIDVNCTGQACVAAGAYSNGTDFYPLIATSKDSGNTWAYTLDSSSRPSVPTDFSNLGAFYSVSRRSSLTAPIVPVMSPHATVAVKWLTKLFGSPS